MNTANDVQTTKDKSPCVFCKGDLNEQTVRYTKELNNRVVIIENVPALVCAQCGEQFYAPDTIDVLHETVRSGSTTATTDVPVYRFPR